MVLFGVQLFCIIDHLERTVLDARERVYAPQSSTYRSHSYKLRNNFPIVSDFKSSTAI